ncbi:hypothetical protein [uncultured Roseobacter sp.]|nr:hypothetical protein [uncultured Roseobacter sp.]
MFTRLAIMVCAVGVGLTAAEFQAAFTQTSLEMTSTHAAFDHLN